MERVGHTVTYFFDGEAVKEISEDDFTDKKDDFPEVDESEYSKAFSKPQILILNTEGFNDRGADSEAFRAPDPAEKFPVQHAEIDSVRVFTK